MDNILIVNKTNEFLCEDIGGLEGFEFPTTRNVFLDLPYQDGSLYVTSMAGARQLSWRGLLKTNVQEQARLLGQACYPGNLKTIKFTTCDGIALQIDIEIDSLVNPYRKGRRPYLITATAPNPRFLSQTLKSDSTLITTKSGGMPIPAAIPAPIGGGANIDFVLVNAGNIAAQPQFEIRGPGTDFIIQNIDTGESLELDLTLTSNEVVKIDTSIANSVYKGSQNVYGSAIRTPAGTWITLKPGSNRFSFNAQSGTSSNTRLTVRWQDTYGNV